MALDESLRRIQTANASFKSCRKSPTQNLICIEQQLKIQILNQHQTSPLAFLGLTARRLPCLVLVMLENRRIRFRCMVEFLFGVFSPFFVALLKVALTCCMAIGVRVSAPSFSRRICRLRHVALRRSFIFIVTTSPNCARFLERGRVVAWCKRRTSTMEATANQITPPSLFTVLRYEQLDLDFGPEHHPDCDDSAQVEDDGHIPYDGVDDLREIWRDDEAAIDRILALSCGPSIDLCDSAGLESLKSSISTRPKNDDLAKRDRAILHRLLVPGGCVRPLRTLSSTVALRPRCARTRDIQTSRRSSPMFGLWARSPKSLTA